MSIVVNAPNIGRRKAVDRTMRGCALLATMIAMVPLILILGFVLVKGVSSLNVAFFTQSYKPPTLSLGGGGVQAQGGVLNGIVGSLVLVFWSTVFALPIGLLAGVFLAEYKTNTVATVVRFCTDVLSAAPSIVVGVVVYALIVLRTKSFSGWAGSIALAILMVPLITRTTEEILRLVPQTVREGSMALGTPKWRTTFNVVVPAAISGIATGVLLSVARAMGETAPLLLTILGNNNVTANMFGPISALPLLTYKYTQSPYPAENNLAWGTALVLTTIVLVTNLLVRYATRSRLK